MKNIKDGGPAYPCTGNTEWTHCEGMSIRDHFAGLAMQGFCTQSNDEFEDFKMVAKESYSLADAMLKAREVQ